MVSKKNWEKRREHGGLQNDGFSSRPINFVFVVMVFPILCSAREIYLNPNKTWPKGCCCNCSLVGLSEFLGCLKVLSPTTSILIYFFFNFSYSLFVPSFVYMQYYLN